MALVYADVRPRAAALADDASCQRQTDAGARGGSSSDPLLRCSRREAPCPRHCSLVSNSPNNTGANMMKASLARRAFFLLPLACAALYGCPSEPPEETKPEGEEYADVIYAGEATD